MPKAEGYLEAELTGHYTASSSWLSA